MQWKMATCQNGENPKTLGITPGLACFLLYSYMVPDQTHGTEPHPLKDNLTEPNLRFYQTEPIEPNVSAPRRQKANRTEPTEPTPERNLGSVEAHLGSVRPTRGTYCLFGLVRLCAQLGQRLC